jgi:hypothetical protein
VTDVNPNIYQLDRDLTRDELIAGLAAIPERLRALLAGASAAAFARRPAADAWSALEVCRHLRDAVQVYGMRFKWIILQDDPFLPNYDEDRWVADSPDGPADIDQLLAEAAAFRAETVRLLRSLPDAAWSRRGRHELNGTVSLEPYVRHELAHEEQHLDQLWRALQAGDASS